MKKSTAEGRKQKKEQTKAFSQQKQRLEDRLEKMYLDKLDGTISEAEYKRLSNKFRGELTDIKFKLDQLKQEKGENIDSVARLLELAQRAFSLYLEQVQGEKRDLLKYGYSNSTLGDGELRPNFRKPFDLIAKSNQEYQRKKVTSPEENDLSESWRPSYNDN